MADSSDILAAIQQKAASMRERMKKKMANPNESILTSVDPTLVASGLPFEASPMIAIPSTSPSAKRKRTLDGSGGAVALRTAGPAKRVLDTTPLLSSAAPDLSSLLASTSHKDAQNKGTGGELFDLLNATSVMEKSVAQKFKSQGGITVKEFCGHLTAEDCLRIRKSSTRCGKLHFRKIIKPFTDLESGDCSYLNNCFKVNCKYLHYEVDPQDDAAIPSPQNKSNGSSDKADLLLTTYESVDMRTYPAQWIQCDVRFLNAHVLGKFSVIMADPPWYIHMTLPYGTMEDDEMRALPIPELQDDGYIFLWVTGRAMELGRELLQKWNYKQVDELIWVKTNQLQHLIRTGRTGHWLNHAKEHCLIGTKGNLLHSNRGLDCDVLVAEVRATSHKPDEVYGLIERLSPGTRKLELFGRQHNVQKNWVTLGNQLEGVGIKDPEMLERFNKAYPYQPEVVHRMLMNGNKEQSMKGNQD